MIRTLAAVVAVVLVAASVSGAAKQPPEPIETALPGPHFEAVSSGPFALAGLHERARPLGSTAPHWARRLYWNSLRVLIALTDPHTGAMIAGERDGWDYVWPRDAAAGAVALQAAGLGPAARRVAAFIGGLDLEGGARFLPDGSRVPGRAAAGDGEGWVAAAQRAVTVGLASGCVRTKAAGSGPDQHAPPRFAWRDRQDYGENVTGDLLGNAIAGGAPSGEISGRFLTARGLARERGAGELDSSAAWAVSLFPRRGLRAGVRGTLLTLARESTPYGIPPMEGWTPGEVWTAPTAWTAWGLAELGDYAPADRLLADLRRAETPQRTLPERVDAVTGEPTSTTPLAWSHAFAILALRARYR